MNLDDHELIGNLLLYGAVMPDWQVVICKCQEEIPDDAMFGLLVDRLTNRITFAELEENTNGEICL